jgi:hypothetical protein
VLSARAAAKRVKRGLDEGYDAFEVFRAVQDHAANAARAHMDTVLLEAFSRPLCCLRQSPADPGRMAHSARPAVHFAPVAPGIETSGA